jgi:hypothetical protein
MKNHTHIKEEVCKANIRLKTEALVVLTWGNVSAIDRDQGLVAIKPSGVPYNKLRPEHIVLVDLESGQSVEEGSLNPSSDTPHTWSSTAASPASAPLSIRTACSDGLGTGLRGNSRFRYYPRRLLQQLHPLHPGHVA